jgi:hypothetical protein
VRREPVAHGVLLAAHRSGLVVAAAQRVESLARPSHLTGRHHRCPILGGLIASLRPESLYGWLWVGLGLSLALVGLAEPYVAYSLVANPGSLPAPGLVNKVLALGWVVLSAFMPFVLRLFPTGRLPSRRSRFLG